jgi:hypothetical protein
MDGSRFDKLTQLVGGISTRRIALQSLLGGTAASAIAVVGLKATTGESAAKKHKKKKCKCKPLDADAPCSSNKQCCTNDTNRACAVAVNASNSDTTCCGALNAECGGHNEDDDDVAPFCCAGFDCNAIDPGVKGTCQPVSDEI